MTMDTLSIDGLQYPLSTEQRALVESIGNDFMVACDEIDRQNGDDGLFHGFDNSYDPYAEARRVYESRIREIVGAPA